MEEDMHLNHTMDVVIEGEPFLSKAVEFRRTSQIALDKWNEFREKYGAYAIAPGGNGLFFDEKSPEGWTKREGRHGFSRPKRGTEAFEEINALPRFPKAWDVFGESLIFDVNYELDGKRQSIVVSELWDGPEIEWNTHDALYARIPNPIDAIKELKAKYPKAVILDGIESWRIPQGLTRIRRERAKFIQYAIGL